MTETLKNLMHERADQPDFALPDVQDLVRNGDRLVRRRRTTMIGGVAALAVVGSLGVASLWGTLSPGSAPVPVTDAPAAATSLPVSWATGSVIHEGSRTIEVGREVTSYVRTSVGYVFADPDGVVHSVKDGDVTEIGQLPGHVRRLVSDEQGPLAGWVEDAGTKPEFVVYDQESGTYVRNDEAGADANGTAKFYALDDSTAYWRDARGAVAVDLETGAYEVLDPNPPAEFDVRDAQNGLRAFWGPQGMRVGVTPQDSRELTGAFGDMGVLSPDGRWYSQDADEPMVFDTATGDRVAFDLADYGFATGYEWLDAGTVVMLAAKNPTSSPVELLACQVPEGSCRVVERDLGTFEELSGGFQLPVGETISGD